MKIVQLITIGAFASAGITAPTVAQSSVEKEKALTAPPALYTDLVACKGIADASLRLACYDEKVLALETAQTNNEVVIAGREQVKEARKGLFGLTLPRIKLFGGSDEEEGNVSQIEETIASVRTLRSGKWYIKLEDGATWQQTDPPRSTSRTPKSGDSIVIKRGSLGSYVASVNGGRSFKMKRVVN